MAFLSSHLMRLRTFRVAVLLLSFACMLHGKPLVAALYQAGKPNPAGALSGNMTPNTGIPAGGTAVVISGHGFSTAKGATLVQFHFNGLLSVAKSIDCTDPQTCIITTPPSYNNQTPLSVPVTIKVNGVTASVGTFIYQVPQPQPVPPHFCMLCEQDHGHCVKKGNQTVCIGRW